MNNFFQFLAPSQDLSVAYLGTYNAPLVTLSVLTAIFASFMALQLSERIAYAKTIIGKIVWLGPGALALGGGVWAMHFVGMLAFSLPCGISYDPLITVLSMLPGVMASAVALWVIGRSMVTAQLLVVGGILMGSGIGVMHYSGMAAMRMDAIIYYSPTLFAASIAFAIILAILSLYAKFVLRHQLSNLPGWAVSLLSAVLMGVAISGMHYIAMEAAYYIPVNENPNTVPGISPTMLAVGIGTITTLLVAIALAITSLGKHMESIKLLEHEIRERERLAVDLEFQKFALDEHAIVSITDVKGNITYVNDKFCAISGYSREELLGKNHRILKSDEHPPELFAEMWRTIANGKPWHGIIKNLKKNGDYYWVKSTIVPFLNEQGKPFQYISIRTDITDRIKAESLVMRAKEDAETANRAKSDLLANMSHELRTPLNAIIGFSESMRMETFGSVGSDKNREYLDDIHHSGQHLLELINDILDVSAIEGGALELSKEDVDIYEVAKATVRTIQPRAEHGKVSVSSLIGQETPLIYADGRRVKQVMLNLLSNAIKFTPEGGKVLIDSLLNDDGSLSLFISDTGYGMSDDETAIALSKFGQVDSGHDRKHEGTGLGLPLTKGLVELHGGTLEIDSLEGYGTMVTVTFPKERIVEDVR